MEFTRVKVELVQLKNTLLLNTKLVPADTILLINIAQSKSFTRINTNKKVIAKRYLYPYNHTLLSNPDI